MEPTSSDNRLARIFFFCLFLSAFALAIFIVKSFLAPLILALTISILFRPVYREILRACGQRKTLAALLTMIISVTVVLVPIFFIGQVLFAEAQSLYVTMTSHSGTLLLDKINTSLQSFAGQFGTSSSVNISQYIQGGLQWVVSNLGLFFTEFFHIAFSTLIMVIAIFYLFRDGDALRTKYLTLSPLPDGYDDKILHTLGSAINSVIRGSLIVGVFHGVFTGALGSLIGGYNDPAIWGVLTGLASFIPGVGTALVIIPAIIFQFFAGNILQGVLLLVWYILAVIFIDNLLMPALLHRGGIAVHPFIILLGVLGGIALFGPIGVILGPLVMAFFFGLLDMYPMIVKAK